MIISSILNLFKSLLFIVFGWINLPNMPDGIINSINSFLNLIFENLDLIGFFVRPVTFGIAIPILIVILNFEKLYHLTMWILKKIPMLNMK